MNRIFGILVLNFLIIVNTVGQGIEFFQGTWEEALEKAKEEDKILFVDAFAKWCGPCKRMAKTVFTQEKAGAFYNKNFINLQLDMEERDGLKFGRKYPVSAYPTLIFLNGEGEVLTKVKGAQDVEGLIKLGKEALRKHDRSAEYAELYEKGNRDFQTVYKYIQALNASGKPSLKIANEYLNEKPELTHEELALFAFEAATEADSRIFDLMLDHKELILEQVEPEEFRTKVVQACEATLQKAIVYDMEILKEETHHKCSAALDKDDAKRENLKFDMLYYGETADVEQYLKATEELLKKFGKKDLSLYRYTAEDIFKRFKEDPKAIEKGLKYSKELYKKESTPDNAVLQVRFLIEAEEYKEGLKLIDEAIEKAGEGTSDGEKLKSIRRYVDSLLDKDS